jgi:hypothetical protein
VRTHRGDPEATLYIAAEPEAEKAMDILKVALARSYHDYEDLGRVTEQLLKALSLQPGLTLAHSQFAQRLEIPQKGKGPEQGLRLAGA